MTALNSKTLQIIQDTAVKAAAAGGKVAVVPLPGEARGEFLVVKPDGSYERMKPLPSARRHVLGGVDEVGQYVGDAIDRLNASPVIWYSEKEIAIVLDDSTESDRSDTVRVPLTFTDELKLLKAIGESWVTQKEMIRLLRVNLADTLNAAGVELIKTLRAMSFGSSTAGHGKFEHGRESLGRDLENEVRSEYGPIPEELTLAVRVFTDRALDKRYPVRCALEIDPKDATFNLTAYPRELQNAIDAQLSAVGSLLEKDAKGPVYLGTP